MPRCGIQHAFMQAQAKSVNKQLNDKGRVWGRKPREKRKKNSEVATLTTR